MIQQIRESSVGIDTSQDNETPQIVELGPENSDGEQVDLYQMFSLSRPQPTPSEDITLPEEVTTQKETANVETSQKEESAPQEPATFNQERMPEEKHETVQESTVENIAHEEAPASQEQAPEPFEEEEMDVPFWPLLNTEDNPFYIEDNLPEDLSKLNIQELMDDILEPYSLQITAIQMNNVPIETLPIENITAQIVELGSEDFDENCDTIQADDTQMDASLQLQRYQRFPWHTLQLTQKISTEPEEEPVLQEPDIGTIESLSDELSVVPQEISAQPEEEPKDQIEDTPAPETAQKTWMQLENVQCRGFVPHTCLFLSALQQPDTTALEEALRNELRSFQNRPKSAISRFFSRVRRAFTCQGRSGLTTNNRRLSNSDRGELRHNTRSQGHASGWVGYERESVDVCGGVRHFKGSSMFTWSCAQAQEALTQQRSVLPLPYTEASLV
ncbi:hypothetical protein WMY93_010198 [Mugilogobius chulae]|uniref:Uncharacterized protein n=1 Tax=Mugilogobius chulae TaxID=88201 RepID=A0AAW0PAC5_9GOBI